MGKSLLQIFLEESITLEKSLLDKLLSPINLIFDGDCTNKAKISLPNVPLFPASKTIPSLYLKLPIPLPTILQQSLFLDIFTPNVFKHLNCTIYIFRV